ncbi:hypothetical protein K1719_032356 [Acacia pycnantha]|nr:hypothetical protein K1719_032356 [Acacia pycnantha]
MHSSSMIRPFCCLQSATSPPSLFLSSKKKSFVFLGSPQVLSLSVRRVSRFFCLRQCLNWKVSATVLDSLFNASSASDSLFEVAAIVTQPPARRDRGKKLLPSPLAKFALDRAYGNILPSKFLNIPPLGTVNIHPSLLPLYRGAAPVQRALQDGVKETGVSLVFTVRELDAGPIIANERFEVDDQIKAPDLLSQLFSEGGISSQSSLFYIIGASSLFLYLFLPLISKLLVRKLPSLFDGSANVKAQPQDHNKATLAPQISPEESWLSFDQEALVLHNKVRAFAGWPGTRAKVLVEKNGLEG